MGIYKLLKNVVYSFFFAAVNLNRQLLDSWFALREGVLKYAQGDLSLRRHSLVIHAKKECVYCTHFLQDFLSG